MDVPRHPGHSFVAWVSPWRCRRVPLPGHRQLRGVKGIPVKKEVGELRGLPVLHALEGTQLGLLFLNVGRRLETVMGQGGIVLKRLWQQCAKGRLYGDRQQSTSGKL